MIAHPTVSVTARINVVVELQGMLFSTRDSLPHRTRYYSTFDPSASRYRTEASGTEVKYWLRTYLPCWLIAPCICNGRIIVCFHWRRYYLTHGVIHFATSTISRPSLSLPMRMQKVVPAALRVATAAKDGAEGKGYLGTPSQASIGYSVWNLTAKSSNASA
jgi:hypothetical protein